MILPLVENRSQGQEVLGGYDKSNMKPSAYGLLLMMAKKVAMSIVYRKDLIREDGPNPTLLYGYGSYGYTIDPSFSTVV